MAFNPFSYLIEAKSEFDKVVWPTRSETFRLTLLVVIVSVIVGAYIAGMDALFTTIVERFIK